MNSCIIKAWGLSYLYYLGIKENLLPLYYVDEISCILHTSCYKYPDVCGVA